MGFAVTMTDAVSEQPEALCQINLYVPAFEKVEIVVVALVAVVIVAVPGLPVIAVHMPVPAAAI